MLHSNFACLVLLAVHAIGMNTPAVPVPTAILAAQGITPPAENVFAEAAGGPLDRTGWAYTADSAQAGHAASNAMDNNQNSFWQSETTPVLQQLPHTVTIDMKGTKYVDGVRYVPRQDGSMDGNIGQHEIYTSTDCANFGDPVAYGTWYDDATEKDAAFEPHPARCVRIVAITEAGGRGPWSSAAEFEVYGVDTYTKPNPALGLWGPTINIPLVPAAAAVEPDTGNLLTWSSYSYDTFGANNGKTQTSTWDFTSKIVSQRLVTETQHDMFCPGISFDTTGRVIITGGDTSTKMSIYTGGSGLWAPGPNMQIGRGYQSQATLGDGSIFTIGGSWNGGTGGKNGEIYSPVTNTWTKLANCPVTPMLTADAQGMYRSDNHAWLFNWKNKSVFQAGPSKQMNWYSTDGNGGQDAAGNRADDGHSMCGDAVMYDANLGKILTVGGSPNYQGSASTSNAHIMTLGNPNSIVTVTTINNMAFSRIFHNSVVLPNGQVFITGGQTVGSPFHDTNSILTPEMWTPSTGQFVQMTPNSIPRNYHSVALLLTDATVISCGGGLCGTCSTNHFDCQIYTPPYLLNTDGSKKAQPTIQSISSKVSAAGDTITVTTGGPVTSFAMIRFSSNTHTTNTDQRRIPLTPIAAGANSYKITLGPANVGQVTPGYWMLFAIDNAGVPSVATTIRIQTE